jgi:hypothetical protein
MDKVKQILELVRKHHFWILCGLAALVGLVAWYLSTATLADQFRTDSDKINKYITDLKGIPPEPKEDWATGAENHIKTVKDDVKSAWETLYSAQKKNVFVWPPSLGADFLNAVEKIEGTTNDLDLPLRERYGDQVRNAVAQLAKIVDAEPPGAANLIANPNQPVVDHRVFWSQINDIQQCFEWDRAPSTLIVKQAQEELWVYKALCDVIAKVNDGSHGNHDAPIKDIISMEIAYAISDGPVNGGHDRIPKISGLAGPATSDTATGGSPTPDATPIVKPDVKSRLKGDALTATVGTADVAATGDSDDIWKNYRYVNKDTGLPMMKADVDGQANNAKFFLMPFKLVVRIDRRDIDRLLVEFRNSPLPMEVKQVRLNSQSIGSAGPIGGGGGGGDHGARSEANDHGGGGRGGAVYNTDPAGSYDRNSILEIQGVVYLIQPPKLDAPAPGDSGQPGSTDATETPVVAPPGNGEAATANKQSRQ